MEPEISTILLSALITCLESLIAALVVTICIFLPLFLTPVYNWADYRQVEYLVESRALEDSLSQSRVELGQIASLLVVHVFSYSFRSKTW